MLEEEENDLEDDTGDFEEQQAFLQSKEECSVKLVRVGQAANAAPTINERVPQQEKIQQPLRPPPVLSNIKEKDSAVSAVKPPAPPIARISWALGPLSSPAPISAGDKPKRNKSLFAQRFDQNQNGQSMAASPSDELKDPTPAVSSSINQAPFELSPEEIRQGHEEIRELLSPASIAFLQKKALERKRKASADPASSTTASISPLGSLAGDVAAARGSHDGTAVGTGQAASKAVSFADFPAQAQSRQGAPRDPALRTKQSTALHTAPPTSHSAPEPRVELPFAVKPEWLHMDIVETEKLRWIGSLAPAAANTTAPVNQQLTDQVRFDFQGNVIPPGTDLPTHLGLHHHGESPEAAGYSLPELAYLVRSSVPAQRAVCLQTLGAIVAKCWRGEYCVDGVSSLSCPSSASDLGARVGAGVAAVPGIAHEGPSTAKAGEVPHSKGRLENHIINDNDTILACVLGLKGHTALLTALSDTHSTNTALAAAGLCALLCYPGDEDFADRLAWLPTGLSMPPLCALDEACKSAEGSVGDMMCELVAKGLVAAAVSVLQSPENLPAHEHCLTLLIRVARHSVDTATTVSKTAGLFPSLLALIRKGRDVPLALTLLAAKLCRVLALAHRSIAEQLLVLGVLTALYPYFLQEDPRLLLVSVEALRVWQACLKYGLAAQDWPHIHSFVFSQIAAWQWPATDNHWQLMSACLLACSALVQLAASPSQQAPSHTLHFQDVAILHSLVRAFVEAMLRSRLTDSSPECSCVVAAAVSFLNAFYTSARVLDPTSSRSNARTDVAEILGPHAAAIMSSCQASLQGKSPFEPVVEGLPYRMSIHPCWQQGCVLPFNRFARAAELGAFYQLLATCCQMGLCEAITASAMSAAVQIPPFTPRDTCLRVLGDMCLMWQRWDVSCCVSFVALTHLTHPSAISLPAVQQLVLYALLNLEPGREHEAAAVGDLLRITAVSGSATAPSSLGPIGTVPATPGTAALVTNDAHSASIEGHDASKPMDVTGPLSSADALQQLFLEDIAEVTGAFLEQSRALVGDVTGAGGLLSMMLPCFAQSGRLPLSSSAPLKPLFNAALLALQQASRGTAPAPNTTLTEVECLQLVEDFRFLVKDCRPVAQFLDSGLLLASTSHIFCLGYNVYKHPTVQRTLSLLLELATASIGSGRGLEDIGDISSQRHFLRVFSFLLEEFRIMSFADERLAKLLLYFCRADIASDFRHQLFDSDEALKLCRCSFQTASEASPYLFPIEADQTLLQKYLHALQCGAVSHSTPALYSMCLHHLAALLFAPMPGFVLHPLCCLTSVADGSFCTLQRQLAEGCLRGLSDAVYGDLLRYTHVPGSVYDPNQCSTVPEERLHHLRALTAADPAAFAFRHSSLA